RSLVILLVKMGQEQHLSPIQVPLFLPPSLGLQPVVHGSLIPWALPVRWHPMSLSKGLYLLEALVPVHLPVYFPVSRKPAPQLVQEGLVLRIEDPPATPAHLHFKEFFQKGLFSRRSFLRKSGMGIGKIYQGLPVLLPIAFPIGVPLYGKLLLKFI